MSDAYELNALLIACSQAGPEHAADREEFIRENAVALVRQLEAKILAQRAQLQRLERQARDFRAYQKMTGAEVRRLRIENEKLKTTPGDERGNEEQSRQL